MTFSEIKVMRFCNETENAREHHCYKDEETASRFQDNQELRYSLRSVWLHAPWVRNIYIVTNGQIPSWLNLQHPRIHMVPHEAIYKNKSHLPTFSSPSIEANLHRIPGLAEHFIYLNDDVMFGRDVAPSDFYTYGGGQRVYYAWAVPDCNEGCGSSWLGDGFCDIACNVSACGWDSGDCTNVTGQMQMGWSWSGSFGDTPAEVAPHCSAGCLDTWLGDRYCDRACRNAECGMDAGDCGMELVYENVHGYALTKEQVLQVDSSTTHSVLPERASIPTLDIGSVAHGDDYDLTSIIYFNISSIIGRGTLTDSLYSPSKFVRTITASPKHQVLMFYFTPFISQLKEADSAPQAHDKETPMEDEAKKTEKRDIHGGDSTPDEPLAAPMTNASSESSTQDTKGSIFFTFSVRSDTTGDVVDYLMYIQLHNRATAEKSKLTGGEPTTGTVEKPTSTPEGSHEVEGTMRQLKSLGTIFQETDDSDSTSGDYSNLPRQSSTLGDDKTILKARIDPRAQEKTLKRVFKLGLTQERLDLERKLVARSGADGIDYLQESALPSRLSSSSSQASSDEKHTTSGQGRKLLDFYADSLRHVNLLLNKEFGNDARHVPAHMPHYLQKSVIERMQVLWEKEFDETSSHNMRASNDMQYAFSYFYYYMHERLPYNFTEVFENDLDVNGDGVLNANEIRTIAATLSRSHTLHPRPSARALYSNWNSWPSGHEEVPDEPEFQWLKSCDDVWISWMPALAPAAPVPEPAHEVTHENVKKAKAALLRQETEPHAPRAPPRIIKPVDRLMTEYNITRFPRDWSLSKESLLNCSAAFSQLEKHLKSRLRNRYELGSVEEVAFVMVRENRTLALREMDGIRAKRNKFVCLNDNINHTSPDAKETIEAIHDLFKALYPDPSPFELPDGQINKFLHTDELFSARAEIRRKKVQIYFVVAAVIIVLLIALRFFTKRSGNPATRSAQTTGGSMRAASQLRHPDPVIIRHDV